MKKFLVLFSLLLVAGMMLGCVGCAESHINTNPSFLKYGTYQGKIMDALTGAAIGGNDLKMYLIQGTDNRKPDKLITGTNDDLVGEYAFSKIPVQIVANDITFKVVVIKAGYQRFEADVSISASFVSNTTDEVFNKIGNIYLYPLGSSAGDITVYVYSPQNRTIPDATVLLRQNVINNNIISYTGDRLLPTAGLYSSLTSNTDASGKATFSGANLTLGGSYSVVVEALTFDGQELRTTSPAIDPFIVGVASTTRVVNMNLATGATSLFAISASNSVPGTITSSGILTITFNHAVLLNTTAFGASLNAANGTLLASPTVNAQLSDDKVTLTLTPTFTTTEKGATITYAYNGNIFLWYSQYSQLKTGYTLFTGGPTDVINIATGLAVSGVVQVTSN